MKKLRGILFDNDGTIADTHELLLASFRHSTQEVLGHALPDDMMMAKVGIPLATQMEDFSPDPDVQQELLKSYRAYNHKAHDQMIAIFPGEMETLRKLQDAGLLMGVVTSKLHWLAQHGIEVLGVAEFMETLVGADDCEQHKPEPGPVLEGVRRLGLEPDECAYVGDSRFDILAGNAAGCISVAVLWGMGSEDELCGSNPDYVCSTFDELADLLVSLS